MVYCKATEVLNVTFLFFVLLPHLTQAQNVFLDFWDFSVFFKLGLIVFVTYITCGVFVFQGASLSEIKKQYRVLSLKYHPDKGGDEATFMRIAKAYAA